MVNFFKIKTKLQIDYEEDDSKKKSYSRLVIAFHAILIKIIYMELQLIDIIDTNCDALWLSKNVLISKNVNSKSKGPEHEKK